MHFDAQAKAEFTVAMQTFSEQYEVTIPNLPPKVTGDTADTPTPIITSPIVESAVAELSPVQS